MKQNKISIFLLLFAVIFLFSCLKQAPQRFTVSGHIYQNCSKQPVANKTLVIYQVGGRGGIIDSFTTDNNGYFSLNYIPKNGGEVRIGVELNVGMGEYGQFQPFQNYPDIAIYSQPTCYLKVSMQVFNNAYTNMDTLYVGDLRPNAQSPYLQKIPGPFTSSVLYEVPQLFINSYIKGEYIIYWGYKINNKEFTQKNIVATPCNTINAIVEIR